MGYSPWSHKESGTTELLTLSLFTFYFFTETSSSSFFSFVSREFATAVEAFL